MKLRQALWGLLILCLPMHLGCSSLAAPITRPEPLSVLTWNIWRGGDRAMDDTDPAVKAQKQQRVVEVIQQSRPDIVAMVETYGSGEAIARALGFHFHARGTNVSIHSRWPIIQDLSVFEPFYCVGALIQRPDGQKIAVFSAWIASDPDIWTDPSSRTGMSPEALVAVDAQKRLPQMQAILRGIREKMASLPEVPVILAGDFNSNSHLDYTQAALGQYGLVVPWPVSLAITAEGFADAYRICNPTISRKADRTWSPQFPEHLQDRIDYIYFRGANLKPLTSTRLQEHPVRWPSDHAAVLGTFTWN